MSLRSIYYFLSPDLRFLARRLWYAPSDLLNQIFKSKKTIAPPKGMIFTGSGDFVKDGELLVQNFIDHANLKANHHVLDIGSGIGRVAIPLTRFLNPNGSYEGFDVVEKGVKWCKENISKQFHNFNFQYVPLKNDLYTDKGNDATRFTFPYPENSFDFACSISVFTHMLPEEVAKYFKELERVMKPNGTIFATFFIFNKTANAESNPAFFFPHQYEHYALMDDKVKAGNVAFQEEWLFSKGIDLNTFEIVNQFEGYWSGKDKDNCLNFQDVLVIRKR
jgi:ubiquinone/menaquinone biosynthesis C-methylase UbiE